MARGNDLAKCASMLNEAFAHSCFGSWTLDGSVRSFAALSRLPHDVTKVGSVSSLMPLATRDYSHPCSQRLRSLRISLNLD